MFLLSITIEIDCNVYLIRENTKSITRREKKRTTLIDWRGLYLLPQLVNIKKSLLASRFGNASVIFKLLKHAEPIIEFTSKISIRLFKLSRRFFILTLVDQCSDLNMLYPKTPNYSFYIKPYSSKPAAYKIAAQQF